MAAEGADDVRPLSLSEHSGNGTLSGGGVRKIYGKRMSAVQLAHKVEPRLGVTLILCLAINATVFTMYLVLHARVHSTLVADVRLVRDQLAAQKFTTASAEPSETSTVAESQRRKRDTEQEEVIPTEASTTTESSTTESDSTTVTVVKPTTTISTTESTSSSTVVTSTAAESTTIVPSSTTVVSTTMMSTEDPSSSVSPTTVAVPGSAKSSEESKGEDDEERAGELTDESLAKYENVLQLTYSALGTFTLLNVGLLAAILASFYLRYVHTSAKPSPAVVIAYRVVVLMALMFLFVELIYLLHPLLYCSRKLREAVDALFASDEWPQSREFMRRQIQERFVCAFAFPRLRTEFMPICDECVTKLKDYLLRTYAVVILILVALVPFLLVAFTWVWNNYAKDQAPVRRIRDRIASEKTNLANKAWPDSATSS